jgi:hypothetical protein
MPYDFYTFAQVKELVDSVETTGYCKIAFFWLGLALYLGLCVSLSLQPENQLTNKSKFKHYHSNID